VVHDQRLGRLTVGRVISWFLGVVVVGVIVNLLSSFLWERPTWLPFALTLALFLTALKVVLPTGFLRQERQGATNWARVVAVLALAAYLTGAFWGVLTKWPPPPERILFVMLLWGTGVALMWSILLSRRRVSEVAIGTSVLLVGLASLVMGVVAWLMPDGPDWVIGSAFLLWGLGSVLYGIGLPLEKATLLGTGFVLIAMGVLPPAVYTLLAHIDLVTVIGFWVTVIGFLLLSLGWLLHGAWLLPDRLRTGGLACLLAGVGFLLIGVVAFVNGDPFDGAGLALAGAGLLFCGVWFPGRAVPDRQRPGGLGFLLVGVGALQVGLLRLFNGGWYGLGFLLIGAAAVLYGVSYLPDHLRRGGLAFSLLGVGGLSLGVANLVVDRWWSAGIGFLLLGLGGLLGGASFLLDRPRLLGGAFLVFSASGLMLGISCLDTRGLAEVITELFGLVGVALLLFGVASLMTGLALLYRPKLLERVALWLKRRHESTGVAAGESADANGTKLAVCHSTRQAAGPRADIRADSEPAAGP
jgi:hypothetical protein